MSATVRFGTLGLAVAATWMASATPSAASDIAQNKEALAPLQTYVGSWRGVGQLRRGSSRGAWREATEWSWRFDDGRAALVADVTGAKYFAKLRLQAGKQPGEYVLVATPAAKKGAPQAPTKPVHFTGQREDGTLVLTADEQLDELPARITIRMVAGGDRMVVLYQKQLGGDRFARLGEVGATRHGSSFAKVAAVGHECVVTGGLGTIVVEFQGKKYYVCCGGCRDLFDEDPAGVLAEYQQRKADQRATDQKK